MAKEIFLNALAHTGEERTAMLAKACADDPALRAAVEKLLQINDAAGQFMSSSIGPGSMGEVPGSNGGPATAMAESPRSEKPGTVIGRFKHLQQIGEGGFGVVYMAEQEHPVRRKVALKVIKLGMDTRQVIARFEAERQALALMDHPNIAKVLEAGATDTGRPYFVMELVNGMPITHYCDREHISLADRLGLFLNVCSAVQHAHQKGIIHRDIKPSNILVTLHDGNPVPKVIDFGIAKAIEQKLTELTMFTEYGQIIGTPAYMSPEQAERSGLDVDTRSDIYSLGVLLYELLTSSLPFDPQRLLSAGHAEMARIIREEEPHRPSTRLRTLSSETDARADNPSLSPASAPPGGESRVGRTSSLLSIARMRHTDPQLLVRTLRGDLDWIVMKCLEKDRTRRYETANGLARDVARFLAGETVSAAPPSSGYRFRKFARRNRAIVTTGAVVAAALMLGLAAATVGFVQAREQRRIAFQERDKARDSAEELRRELYASQIEKIQRILSTDGLEPVKTLLAACDPELRGWEWDRLNFLADSSAATVHAADGGIGVVKFSGDGSTFMTCGNSVTRLWDAESLETLAEMKDEGAPHQSTASLSLDGRVLVTSDGANIHVWDARSGILQQSFPAARPAMHRLAINPSASRVAIGYGDGGIGVYDLFTGALLLDAGEKNSSGRTVAFSQDGKLLLSASTLNDVSVCSAADGRQLWAKRGAAFVLMNAVFSPDDSLVASVGHDSRLWVRKSDTGELVYTVDTSKGSSSAVAFHPDGSLIAVGGIDGLISFFRTSNGEKLYSLHGHEVEVTAIDFDPSGRFLLSGARDGSVKKWHLGTSAQAMVGHTHTINSLAFSVDDKYLWAIGGRWKDLHQIDVAELRKVPADCPMDAPQTMARSLSDERLAFSGHDQDTYYLILTDRHLNLLHRCDLPDQIFAGLAFSPDGRRLIAGSLTGNLRLYDAVSGEVVWDYGTRGARDDAFVPNQALFSPDGRYVINGSREGMIRVLDTLSGELVREFAVSEVPVGPLALDGAGDRLFCGGMGKIDVWDWRTGELRMTMHGHTGYVGALAMLPDDSRLVSAGADATVGLWDVSSARQVMVIGRHDGPVFTIAVSHDGATIATGGEDNSLRLWETRQPSPAGLDARYKRARAAWVPYRDEN